MHHRGSRTNATRRIPIRTAGSISIANGSHPVGPAPLSAPQASPAYKLAAAMIGRAIAAPDRSGSEAIVASGFSKVDRL
jgi:hypothetical protein